MVIRNIHVHNTKGIILSWAILGQNGHRHINNHSQKYVLNIFEQLGYVLDVNLTKKFSEASTDK